MKMQSLLLFAITVLSSSAMVAVADDAHHTKAATGPSAQAAAGAQITQGEVKKVDREAAKITIEHGPIVNLDMPGMTMVFRVKDPAMLSAVKAGDKIRFTAEKSGGAIMVTQLEPAK